MFSKTNLFDFDTDTPTSKQPYEFQKIAQRRASIDFQDPLKRAMEEADRLRGRRNMSALPCHRYCKTSRASLTRV